MKIDDAVAWLLTFALHAGVMLAIAWVLDRTALRRLPAWREVLWRVALFGGALSASVQLALSSPFAAHLAFEHGDAVPAAHVAATRIDPASAPANATHDAIASIDARRGSVPASVSTVAHADRDDAASAADGRITATVARFWPGWPRVLVAAWLAGTLLLLGRLGFAWLGLVRVLRDATPLEDAALARDAAALARAAHIDAPHLASLATLASPVAAHGRRIALPCWALELLDRAQLRAMLAHETAHLARRDPAWKLATAAWCALLWFLPLALLARRRLDEIAELSCDAWAARHLGDGRPLAECLAECASRHAGLDELALAPAMAQRESPLLQRIEHLIEGHPMNIIPSRKRAFAATAALILAAALLPGFTAVAQTPPAPPAPPVPPAPLAPPAPPKDGASRIHISSDAGPLGQSTYVEVGDGNREYRARIKGKITFTDRDDDVATLADGGSATFEESAPGMDRRIEYRSTGGKLVQRYFVDEHEQPLDAAGRTWLASAIAGLVRESALGAEARVKRIHASGGADAVLDEIARIQSGYARGVYLKQLAGLGHLSAAQVTRAIGLVDGIDSDYEKRNALSALGSAQPFDAAQQTLVVAQARKIGSDYERAELLTGLLPSLAPDPALRTAWLAAANGIGSDFEHRRTLTALLAAHEVDDAMLATVIDASKTIGSDFERRSLLVDAVGRVRDAERVAVDYAAASADIGSDFERREALLALVRAPKFGAGGTRAVLDAAGSIGSDHECSEVLVALAGVMPNDADLIARYRSVARRLGDFERGEAERALDRFAG